MPKLTKEGIVALAVVLLLVLVVAYLALKPTTRAAGRTFYVALTGSDSNAGSAAAPWRYLSTAVSRLAAGDRLCVGAGTWTDSRDVIDSQRFTVPSGTDLGAGAITIGACNGDVATITPPANLVAVRLTTGAPHHLIVQDLRFSGALQPEPNPADSGAELLYTSSGTHHIRFERVLVEHTKSHAVQFSMANSTASVRTAIEVLDSTFRDIGNASGDSGHGGPGQNNGYAIYTFTAGNVIRGNTFTETRGTALVVYGPDNVVDGNRFTKIATRNQYGYAVNIGSSSHPVPSTGNAFTNNAVYDAPGGVNLYTNADAAIDFNTFYKAGQWAVHAQYCRGGAVRNNIFRLVTAEIVNDSPSACVLTTDRNLGSAIDPLFLQPDRGDFRLASKESPAYNAGVRLDTTPADAAGTARPQNLLADLGAYELVVDDPIGGPVADAVERRPVLVPALGAVVEAVSAGGAVLNSIVCHNPNGDRAFVQAFDQAGVARAGEALPAWVLGIGPGQSLPITGLALPFAGALRVAATTTPTGGTGPVLPLTCSFGVTVLD